MSDAAILFFPTIGTLLWGITYKSPFGNTQERMKGHVRRDVSVGVTARDIESLETPIKGTTIPAPGKNAQIFFPHGGKTKYQLLYKEIWDKVLTGIFS